MGAALPEGSTYTVELYSVVIQSSYCFETVSMLLLVNCYTLHGGSLAGGKNLFSMIIDTFG
jgi:hypothetical protein